MQTSSATTGQGCAATSSLNQGLDAAAEVVQIAVINADAQHHLHGHRHEGHQRHGTEHKRNRGTRLLGRLQGEQTCCCCYARP